VFINLWQRERQTDIEVSAAFSVICKSPKCVQRQKEKPPLNKQQANIPTLFLNTPSETGKDFYGIATF